MKKHCHFQLLDFIERKAFIENAWCSVCNDAKAGKFGSTEYEVYEKKFIVGYCRKCGTKIVSEIIDKTIEE
jgi:hypothetical protein